MNKWKTPGRDKHLHTLGQQLGTDLAVLRLTLEGQEGVSMSAPGGRRPPLEDTAKALPWAELVGCEGGKAWLSRRCRGDVAWPVAPAPWASVWTPGSIPVRWKAVRKTSRALACSSDVTPGGHLSFLSWEDCNSGRALPAVAPLTLALRSGPCLLSPLRFDHVVLVLSSTCLQGQPSPEPLSFPWAPPKSGLASRSWLLSSPLPLRLPAGLTARS